MTELILDRGGDRGQSWLSLDVSVSCWQENRHSQISETDRSKHSGSDLQVTPPGRTFLSGTCGPAPTYRWRGYPQCPGRQAMITLRERHFWNRCEVCLDHSPLLVLELFGSVSTPDCSQTHLQRQRHPVNHSTCAAQHKTLLPSTARPFLITMSQRWLLFAQEMVRIIASIIVQTGVRGEDTVHLPFRTSNLHICQTEGSHLPVSHTQFSFILTSKKVPEDRVMPPRSPCVRLLVWGRRRVWLLCFKIHNGTQVMENECRTLINCWQQMPVCKSTHLFCLLLFTLYQSSVFVM